MLCEITGLMLCEMDRLCLSSWHCLRGINNPNVPLCLFLLWREPQNFLVKDALSL